MTHVKISGGCNDEATDQFIEGTDTCVRVCSPEAAQLVVITEQPSRISVLVDGEETFTASVLANQRAEFSLRAILLKRKGRGLGSVGLRSLFGLPGKTHSDASEPLPESFAVAVFVGAGEELEGTYRFRMLPNEGFVRHLDEFLAERSQDDKEPVFTQDARPPQALNWHPRCPDCGVEIEDPIAGCENAECPSVKAAERADR